MSTTVLVIKPKSLSNADKRLLREGGVICVESDDPTNVRLLSTEGPPLDGGELFYAAMMALSKTDNYGRGKEQREEFTQQVALLAKASREHKGQPE